MRPFLLSFFAAAATAALASQVPLGTGPAAPSPASGVTLVDAILDAGHSNPGAPAPGPLIDIGKPGLTLADKLSLERKASLWWDYARDIAQVTTRLTHAGTTTLLVPLDKAILAMPRKPHQNPSGPPANDDEAKSNVEKFLSAHIVPADIQIPSETVYQTLLETVSVSVVEVEESGKFKVIPGDIPVVEIKDASNGRIVYIDGVVPY